MKRKTLQLTVIFFLSTLIQVISNIVLTRLFGTSLDYTHFLAAVTLPTIFVTVIYGTLNDALLPLYSEKLVKDKEGAESYFFSQLTTLTIFSILITLILNIISPFLMRQFFGSSALFQPILVNMFIVMNLAIPFSTFVTILGVRLYAHKQYSRFPLAQMIGSVMNLLLVIALFKSFGAWGLVYSFVISIIIQIIFVLPKKLELKIGSITPTLALWFPLIIGITALKSDSLIVRTFSSQLPAGFIVYHNLISKVCSLSAGLITIGIQILFLPNIIEKLANKDFQKTGEMVNKVKAIAIALSVLLVLAVHFISPFFIKMFFVGGKFTVSDFDQVLTLIPYYLIPVFGWGIISVFLQPLYALKKHLHVGILNTACFSVAWLSASEISKTSPSLAISVGLSILLLGSALGSEIIWQLSFNKLKKPR